jgi:hypothetical protein
MDLELDRFKRINLAEYAASCGYRLVRREPTRGGGSRGSTSSSLLMRNAATDDKIVVRLDRDGHWTYFSIRDDRDNGTIVDFLQRRGATTIAQVRTELRSWCGEHRPTDVFTSVGGSRDPTAIWDSFGRARVVANHAYLNMRGLRPETLACARFVGTWRVDQRGELLFPHYDGVDRKQLCGFERKTARFAGFVAGGTKTIWTSNARDDDTRIVLTEAVIDAFSYHQLHQDPRTRYTSTSGAIGERQARHVALAIEGMPAGATVVAATDNDDAGEKLAARIRGLAGEKAVVRHRAPAGKDWNEYLQLRERDYIRSLRLVGRELGR